MKTTNFFAVAFFQGDEFIEFKNTDQFTEDLCKAAYEYTMNLFPEMSESQNIVQRMAMNSKNLAQSVLSNNIGEMCRKHMDFMATNEKDIKKINDQLLFNAAQARIAMDYLGIKSWVDMHIELNKKYTPDPDDISGLLSSLLGL